MRIAAANLHPVWGNKTAATAKVIEWIRRAAAERIDLLAFPETYLSGYPIWQAVTDASRWEDPQQKAAFAYYLDAAVELDGPEIAQVTEAVRDLGVFVYLGTSERGRGAGARGTVYCTLVAIDPAKGVVSAHRKLMPTFDERMAWGIGDGHGLRVHTLANGWRVGGLNCWENWMPQARHAMYAGGEDLHVSVWPGSCDLTRDITRFTALEGRVYVLAASALLSLDDIPRDFPLYDEIAALPAGGVEYDGGSAIAGPDGRWLAEPVAVEERLVCAEIDLRRVREERQNFDPTGHYSRPDVFEVRVNRRRLEAVTFEE